MKTATLLLLFATLSACQSTKHTAPKSSAGGPTIDYNIARVEIPPTGAALILGPAAGLGFENRRDTLQIAITITDLAAARRLETENRDLKKRRDFWRVMAAVFFAIATGHALSDL